MPGPDVYVVGDYGRHFHREPSCWRISAGQQGKRRTDVIRATSLGELAPRQQPCRTCYPDAPRVRVRTPYCHTCASKRPCAHNGGVQVKIPRVWRYGSRNLIDPGEVTYQVKWVWPDRAGRYEPV